MQKHGVDMKRLFFLLLFLPGLSQASKGWTTSYSQFFYSTPEAACQPFVDYKVSDGSSTGFIRFDYTSENGGYCHIYNRYGEPDSRTAYFHAIKRVDLGCPDGETYNFDLQVCVPGEPDQCEAGKETSVFKFVPDSTVVSYPARACLLGCTYSHTSSTPCWWPHTKGDVVGSNCKITYTGTGEECSGGDDPDSPPDLPPDSDEPPDGPPNSDCKRFTNADGSWGYDCNPKPDPDENNQCPPGYQMQGNTCFRIPPDDPDYDPDKDPQKPGGDDPDDDTGSGSGDGDLKGVAQETTLKSIDKTLKDIDGSIKSGNSTTHSLLQGIKDAIGKIPGGGGGGPKPGSGDGDGDGDGPELTAPEQGSFEEASVLENEEIAELQDAINAKFAEIKAFQLPGLTLSGGGGNLPVVSLNFGIFGSHQLDFNELQQPLIMMGNVFVFICGLLALFIMFVRT